jgi:putative FmdB family regulatory protein
VPKYDYRCGSGHVYEKREGFDAPAVQVCEVCGMEARRVLTPPAIVFKGSGWYVTDSRGSTNGASPSTSSTAANDSTTSESKADTAKSDATKSESSKSESSSLPAAAD